MKKLVAVILSLILCLSCATTAFAQDDPVIVHAALLCNEVTSDLIVILTYNAAFLHRGKLPQVTLQTPGAADTVLPAENVIWEIYFYGYNCYPQLFIRLPEQDERIYENTVLSVEAGVFKDIDGGLTPAVTQAFDSLQYAKWNIMGHSNFAIPDERLKAQPKNTVLAGKPVTTNTDEIYGIDNEMWKGAGTFTVGEERIGAQFVPQAPGEYTVTFRLNAFIWDAYTFTALDEAHAHRQGMRSSFVSLLKLPRLLADSIVAILLPSGIGLIVFWSSLLTVPLEAFLSLFRTPYQSVSFD